MKIAAIDIGTNSTRILVAKSDEHNLISEIHRSTTITRLGAGFGAGGMLQPEAIERTLAVLREYAAIASESEVDFTAAVATAAVREAKNSADFLEPAEKILGRPPRVIDGETEAAFTFAGAISDPFIRRMGHAYLVIDIGGGSTEIARGGRSGQPGAISLPLGCVRLTERFLASDPPRREEMSLAATHVRSLLEASFAGSPDTVRVPVAVAGTATSLASIELALETYDPIKTHRFNLAREMIEEALERLSSMKLVGRQAVTGLEPERADSIVAGAIILFEILSFFKYPAVIVSERDILDGIVISVRRQFGSDPKTGAT